MNRILIFEDKLQDFIQIKDPETLTHLHRHLLIQKGQTLKCTLVGQGLFEAQVTRVQKELVEITPTGSLKEAVSAPFHLHIGLSRPPSLKKILEHATTLGVSHFHFFKSSLSEKSYLQSKVLQNKEIQKRLKLGLAQSACYAHLPQVKISKEFPRDFFKDLKGQIFRPDPFKCQSFSDFQLNSPPVHLILGPERGFTKQEVSFFESLKIKSVRLCPGILRVEIATFAALGQAQYVYESSEKK